jgi:hypothetical protein
VRRPERALLKRVTEQAEKCSAYERRLAKRRRVLREAAAMSRRGKRDYDVLDRIQAQVPEAVITVQDAL